ncbi:MAG: PTS sugar transporter subunit IIA [Myxococcales bacterium]|nr:PTS sugar transporter subunit IIA [Polyangiaceae bacterium]MDW8250437.1 PTS sugar transporter subunit IIA [Myxococcales bacterium]
MKLTEIVTPDRVRVLPPDVKFDKRHTLLRIAELLAQGLSIPPGRILATLEEREQLQSTGIGDGVAMPHGTLEGIQGQVGALLLCPGGVDFEAIDEKPSYILFGLVGPKNALEHLKILARMSRVLRNSNFRARLVSERDASLAYQLLRMEDDAVG